MRERRSLEARFLDKVHHEPMSGCWLWGGCLDSKGYGQIRRGPTASGVAQATRVALQIHLGVSVPAGLVVCHRCDNPPCVNPDHLFIGTHQDNSDDKHNKGRARPARGSRHYEAKITEADVVAIRRLYRAGALMRDLAASYGLKTAAVGHIVVGRTWKHVTEPTHRKNRRKETTK